MQLFLLQTQIATNRHIVVVVVVAAAAIDVDDVVITDSVCLRYLVWRHLNRALLCAVTQPPLTSTAMSIVEKLASFSQCQSLSLSLSLFLPCVYLIL